MEISNARACYKIPLFIIIALVLIYFINCFTPLRLTNDTVRYLRIKEWIEAGKPAGDAAGKDFLPFGYVWFLMLLSKLHLAKSFFISLIHLLYLLGSLWFVTKIFGSRVKAWQLFALCMLNWAAMKFVITPLSEMQFLFFSMGTLYFYNEFDKRGKSIFLGWALLFCLAAMVTRTAGVVLLVSVIVTALLKNRQSLFNMMRNSKWFIAASLASIAVFVLLFNKFHIVNYIQDHQYYFTPLLQDPLAFIVNNLRNHFIDLAALSLNSPSPKLNFLGSPALVEIVFLFAGILTLAWIFYLLFKRSSSVSLLIKVYLVFYTMLVLVWPFFEPRFWVPAMTLFMAVILQEQKITKPVTRYFFLVYKTVYVVVGLTALAYYTYTSFNKKVFAGKQDAGIWRNEYETHFFGKPLSDTATVVREPILKLIKKYD